MQDILILVSKCHLKMYKQTVHLFSPCVKDPDKWKTNAERSMFSDDSLVTLVLFDGWKLHDIEPPVSTALELISLALG